MFEGTKPLDHLSEPEQIAAVTRDWSDIRHISNPSEAVQLAACNKCGQAFLHIKNPSEKVKIVAADMWPHALAYMKKPSLATQLAALRHHADSIIHINPRDFDHKVWEDAEFKKNTIRKFLIILKTDRDNAYWSVRKVIDQLRAFRCPWPELDVIAAQVKAVLSESAYSENKLPTSEEELIAGVSQNGYAIDHIENPSEAVQLAAVTENGNAIQYIENPSEAVQLAAVNQNAHAIRFINDPSIKAQLAAVNKSASAVRRIKNLTKAVALAAVEKDGGAIEYIKNPDKDIQMAALKSMSFPNLLNFVKRIHPDLWADKNIKKTVLAELIADLKSNMKDFALDEIDDLERHKCPWPELAVIAKTVRTG